MEVNKSLHKAYQILSPLEKKAMQDLMTLQLLKQNHNQINQHFILLSKDNNIILIKVKINER